MSRRNRRKFMMNGVNDKCCYCGKEVFEPVSGQGKQLHNTATVEHLYPKFDYRRAIVDDKYNVILACHECNSYKSLAEQDIMLNYPIERHAKMIDELIDRMHTKITTRD